MVFRKLARMLGQANHRHAPQVRLAAFGKHPGWLDHMEEIGLETDRLIQLRRMLYSEGINRNIDSGAWNLDPTQAIERFKHAFVWRAGSDFVVGRLWSSTDARGRSLYPMVVAAQCSHLSFMQSVFVVMPRLVLLEERITSTKEAEDVRRLLSSAQNDFVASLQSVETPGVAAPSASALARLSDCPQFGPDAEGLIRILYQIDSDMGDMRTHKVDSRSGTMKIARAHHIRVPRCCERATDAALLWHEFLNEQLSASIPLLILIPLEHEWVDLIPGDPTAAHIFCLKAAPEKIPLASDIPYSIPDEFRTHARASIDKARQAATADS